MAGARVVVASNRGPVSFTAGDDGSLTVRRGGGGLVSAVGAVAGTAATLWICAALTSADRAAARAAAGGRLDVAGHDTGGAAVRMLDIDEAVYFRAYNGIANSTLWFVNHLLFDLATEPVFDAHFRRQWEAYAAYNATFAAAIAEEAAPGARVLVQDYHLTLVPRLLRESRPDLTIAHFTHTPWSHPRYFSLLPDDVSAAVLTGILGADSAGFLSPRWAEGFADCCRQLLGASYDAATATVHHAGRATRLRVHALGVDRTELTARAAEPDVQARRGILAHRVGERRVLLRIDRTELSKNIVRGLLAYGDLLRRYPQWRERVVHLVFAYPSRHDLPEYREYTGRVQRTAQAIVDEFGTAGWSPVLLEVSDDHPRSLAAYRLADVLVVNPVRDGMNLVAKEGPVLSDRGCALVLSREAGAADELGGDAFVVNPYDVCATADALHAALSLDESERAARCARLADASAALPPRAWLAAQLDALEQAG